MRCSFWSYLWEVPLYLAIGAFFAGPAWDRANSPLQQGYVIVILTVAVGLLLAAAWSIVRARSGPLRFAHYEIDETSITVRSIFSVVTVPGSSIGDVSEPKNPSRADIWYKPFSFTWQDQDGTEFSYTIRRAPWRTSFVEVYSAVRTIAAPQGAALDERWTRQRKPSASKRRPS